MKILKHNSKFEVFFESEQEEIARKFYYVYYKDPYMPNGFGSKYIAKKNALPIGYLDTFVAKCLKQGITITIENDQVKPLLNQRFNLKEDRKPRDWHIKAMEAIDYYDRGVISAPTGTGKSYLIENTVATKKGITLIVTHSTDIRDEFQESLSEKLGSKYVTTDIPQKPTSWIKKLEETPEIPINKEMSPYEKSIAKFKNKQRENMIEKVWHKPVTIICYHSLTKLPHWYLELVEVLLIDECDFAAVDTIRNTVMQMKSCFHMYGFSATPWRDQAHMDLLMRMTVGSDIIFDYNPKDAILDGVICKPSLESIPSEAPDQFIKYKKNWRDIVEIGFINNSKFNKQIAKLVSDKMADNHKVFVAVDEVKHSEAISEKLKELNITPVELNGTLSKTQFKAEKEKIKTSTEAYAMIGTGKVGRGTDIPNLDVLVLAINGKTSNKFIQKFGRILRSISGKSKNVEIYIFFNWWNNVTMKHSKQVIRIFEDYYDIKAQR
jgi:superfamily II DNA or RNA helicase